MLAMNVTLSIEKCEQHFIRTRWLRQLMTHSPAGIAFVEKRLHSDPRFPGGVACGKRG